MISSLSSLTVFVGDVGLTPAQKMNEMKLKVLCDRRRWGFTQFTTLEALDLAVEAEVIMKQCGVHDPAYDRFMHEYLDFERLALFLEAREPYKDKFPPSPVYTEDE